MDQGTSTVLAAAIGAFAGIGGGVVLDAFKRRRDRAGVAMALTGVIEMQIGAIKRRKHVEMFELELAHLKAGQSRSFFGFADKDQVRDFIADAYVDKYGMLEGQLPARVIHYFQTMWGIRVDLARLVAGGLPTTRRTVQRRKPSKLPCPGRNARGDASRMTCPERCRRY